MQTQTSEWRRTADMLGLVVPIWKAHALDYLESVGFQFCVHFGTENAVEQARKHWNARKHRVRVH